MSRVVRSSHYGTVPVPLSYAPQQPYIYCPVCRMDYPQSQTDSHILKHTIQSVRFSSKKEEQVSVSTQPSRQTFTYPMVEPLEFHTSDLSRISGKDRFNFTKEEKNKKVQKVVTMVDKQTQTSNKPLLQYRSEETDLYNCFDSVFNGQGFQSKDVLDRNVGLASKRHLNDWEIDRVNKK